MGSNSNEDQYFKIVQNGSDLLPILQERLPKSANVYNMALTHENFKNEMKIYVLNGDMSSAAWIVFIFEREDYGRDINMSAPSPNENGQYPEFVKDAFINSKLFDWEKPFFFTALDRPVSRLILEVSCFVKGSKTTVNPSVVFYTPTIESIGKLPSIPKEAKVNSLNSEEGVNLIHDNWVYAKEGTKTYVRRILEHNPSCGLFISTDGKLIKKYAPVSGVVTTANGFLGMLFTAKKWRNHHFGTIVMKSLMQDLINKGFIPCSVVEEHNKISKKFHEKLGMKISHYVDFVYNI